MFSETDIISSVVASLWNIRDNRAGGLLSVVHVNVISVSSSCVVSVEWLEDIATSEAASGI